MKKFFTNVIPMWIMVIMVLLSACQKEASESPLEGLVPTCDTTTIAASEEVAWDTTEHQLLMPRVSVNINLNLSKFRYVWQDRVMEQWNYTSKFSNTGKCGYPVYKGTMKVKYEFNNTCGLACAIMGVQITPHDSYVNLPDYTTAIALRFSEFIMRYKLYNSGYDFGDEIYLNSIGAFLNGSSSFKSEFSNWNVCSEKSKSGATIFSGTSSRANTKNFIRTQLQLGRPIIALISIKSKYGSADDVNYIATSGGGGHMVLIVGLTEDDINGIYQIRFKDPYTNNPKTYIANYTRFLDSMIDAPTNYNALAIKGQ